MKRVIAIIILYTTILLSILLICGCKVNDNIEHTHSFTQENTSEKYLASSATCTEKAIYFYSCECGEKGTKVFSYGEFAEHPYSNVWFQNDTMHWHESTCIHNIKKDEEPHEFVNDICVKCNYDKTIKVSSVSLNKTNITLNLDETEMLIATVLPQDASSKEVIWSSSNSAIVSVDNGMIVAIDKGVAEITATVGNTSATCRVTVVDPYEAFSFSLVGNSYTLSAYIGEGSQINVPSSYRGKPITIIGEKAFYDCAQITKIILPDTIKEIGIGAFGYCTSLKEIQISACTRLKEQAFVGCTSLSEITLPNGLVSIGAFPFSQCSSLKTVKIMSGTIPNNVFQCNTFIKEIFLGSNVTSVAQNAFWGCTALEKLTMPRVDENQNFNSYYFGLLTQSHTIYRSGTDKIYPDEVKSYSVVKDGVTRVFGLPTDTAKWYYEDDGITYDEHFYSYSKRPIEVTAWESVYEVNVGVTFKRPKSWTADFYYTPNSSLKELVITDQLISMYSDVFKGLKCKIDIKQKYPVQAISLIGENEVFVDDFNLNNYSLRVKYTDGFVEDIPFETKYLQSDIGDLNTSGTKTLLLTYGGVKSEFILTLKLHTFDNAVLDDVTFVYDGTTKSLSVNGIPEGTLVTYDNNGQIELGEYTVTATLSKKYYQTKTLTAKLYIRQARYSIYYMYNMDDVANNNPAEYVFGKETTISAPTSRSGVFVEWYTNQNFTDRFTGITSDTYGDLTLYAKFRTIFNISDSSVTGLTKEGKTFKEIVIPAKVNGTTITSIKESAFVDCKTLTNVIISDTITSIGSYAFSGCTNLASITIGDSVTSIGFRAFKGCDELAEINYTGNIVHWCQDEISDELMRYGKSEKTLFVLGKKIEGELTIPNNVTSIGNFAFRGCNELTTVNWNATNCTSAGSYDYPIFNGCTNLSNVIIGDNVQIIPSNAFSGCIGLTEIAIPNSVTIIGAYAFSGCSELIEITIPANVTFIGASAFYGCKALTNIIIPNSLTSISGHMFDGCSGLREITIPDGVTSIEGSAFRGCRRLTIVNWNATNCTSAGSYNYLIFEECTNLSNVIIGDNVQTIPDYAFYNCSGLTSVTMGNHVTSIGAYAFSNCSGLTEITITNGVTSIGIYAFSSCSRLTTVNWNATKCTSVGSYNCWTFEGCTNLSNVIIGDNVQTIPDYAFCYCSGLKSVTMGNSVTSIGASAFYGCKSLTNIKIPDGLISISEHVFDGCSGLKEVTIPDDVTSICAYAFSGCSGLVEITIPTNVTFIGISAFYGCKALTNIKIPDSLTSISNQVFDGCSGLKEISIPDGVTSIGAYAFRGCSGLIEIKIPNNVTFIGTEAFYDCKALVNITIPDSLTSINEHVFDGCSGLKEISIPNGVTSIGESAFKGCSGLTIVYWNATKCLSAGNYNYPIFKWCTNPATVIIGDNVQIIPDYAFSYFSGLKSVKIGNSVTSIGASSFSGCSGLIEITIPANVTFIGSSAFYGCQALTNIIVPDSLTSISDHVLDGCSGLKEITIPNSVTSIGVYAFRGCNGLSEMTIPDSVTSIGEFVFYGCSGLTNVTIGNNVASIGLRAFSGCSGLSEITISDSVTSIEGSAFHGCSGLATVTIGRSVNLIGSYAFYGCNKLIKVYYKGGKSEWANISISSYNDSLTSATRYYYSEEQPTLSGNYWHYDVDGVTPTIWKKEN